MEQFGDLKLDDMEVDCQLALSYVKKMKSKFSFCPMVKENLLQSIKNNKIESNSQCYKILQDKIKENAELFAQLEWLMRKIPKAEVKKYDITLMIQYLQYYKYSLSTVDKDYHEIVMADDTPLALLGLIAVCPNALIRATPNTDVVCHLFAELCHEAGFKNTAVIVDDQKESRNHIDDLAEGCTAVITNKADVDSAIDVILDSTVKYIWKIKNILVQEDTYQAAEKALQWKCSLKNGPQIDEDIKKLCKDVFSYEDKVILVEYTGSKVPPQSYHVILLQTYKTSNDLRNFQNSFCISLWSNDINEANLIAHASPVDLVWINDYGSFGGPPQAIRVMYGKIARRYCNLKGFLVKHYSILNNSISNWLKLDYNVRLDTVYEIIKKNITKRELKQFLEDCRDVSLNSSLMENGKIFTIVPCEGSIVYSESSLKSLAELVNGKGIVIFNDETHEEVFKAIENEGLPLTITYDENVFVKISQKYKLIIQNCGTHC